MMQQLRNELSENNGGSHLRWHAASTKARPQKVEQLKKSVSGHAHGTIKVPTVARLDVGKGDARMGAMHGCG